MEEAFRGRWGRGRKRKERADYNLGCCCCPEDKAGKLCSHAKPTWNLGIIKVTQERWTQLESGDKTHWHAVWNHRDVVSGSINFLPTAGPPGYLKHASHFDVTCKIYRRA